MAKSKNETSEAQEEKPKRTVMRKPLYVLVPTGYEEEVVAPVDDEANVTTLKRPVGYKLLGKVETKKQVSELLSQAGLDVTNGVEDVIVLRANPLPIKVSTQVLVRF